MHPILIDFGTRELPWLGSTHLFLPTYGMLFAIAVLVAWGWFVRRARRLGIRDDLLFNLTFYTLVGGLVGAKLLLIVVDWRVYLAHPGEILSTIRSAGVLAGGVAAGTATFALYAVRHRLPLFSLADAIAPPLALAQGIGRLGCFAAGCCWGRAVDAGHPLAVTFTDPAAHAQTGVPLGEPLIATQLLEAGFDFVLVALLVWITRREVRPAGTAFWVYLFAYSLGRGLIEIWRGDAHRGLYFGGTVSTSQLFALAGAIVASFMLLRGMWTARHAPDPAAS